MRVVIVEDETAAAVNLVSLLRQTRQAAAVDRDRAGPAAQPPERGPRRLQRQPRGDRRRHDRGWDRSGSRHTGDLPSQKECGKRPENRASQTRTPHRR